MNSSTSNSFNPNAFMKIIKTAIALSIAGLISIQPVFAASVSGQVTYKGKFPKLRDIKMGADPVCLTKHKDKVFPQTIELGPNKEMANVFLHIVEGLPKKKYPVPEEPMVLTQAGCMYDPPVFGVMAGRKIRILNPDGTLHNVHALPKKNPEFNLAMPKFRKETVKQFDIPEFMFPIKCDVHPWMITWVTVTDHPYFTVTDEAGTFKIDNLPPGNYVLEAWQQRLEPQRISFTVAEGENKEANFVFQRPDGK